MKHDTTILILMLLIVLGASARSEPCREIHGRAILNSGDSFLAIWHIGTHHTFFVVDEKSSDLILDYLHYPESDHQALFADFTLCPTAKFKQGASQQTIVKRIRHAHIETRK
jgi:hypothetical protein